MQKEANTKLYAAAAKGDEARTAQLIAGAADIRFVEDVYKYTPLHIASEGGHVKCVKCLLDADKDRGSKDAIVDASDEVWHAIPLLPMFIMFYITL